MCSCFTEDSNANEGTAQSGWSELALRARATSTVATAVMYQAHAILTPALKELGARVEGQGGSGNSMNTPHERPFIQRSAFTVHLPVKVEPSAALEAIDRAFQAHLKAAGMVFDRGAPAGFPMNQISIVNYDYRPPDANLKAGQVTLGLLPLPDRIHVWTVAVDFP